MTTSRIGDLLPVPPPRTAPAPDTAPRIRRGGTGAIVTTALVVLASVPGLAGLLDLWRERGEPYLPSGDHALLTIAVDAVGQHEVLLGAYSRFGWYHPGPMATYLMAGPYYVLGGALQSLSASMLLVSAVSAAASVWLVHRRAGVLVALWALVAITLTVHLLGGEFLRDPWNPYLPVLPFLAGTLLCWTAIRGEAWALPVTVVPLSLAAQSHVGYLPAVASVGAALCAGLLVRAIRRARRRSPGTAAADSGRPRRSPWRWLLASVVGFATGIVLWLPPIVQQVTGTPGNAGVLYDHLVRSSPEEPAGLATGLRIVADEFGRLPAHLVGAGPSTDVPLLPERWPALAIAVGIALFAGAMAVAVGRRRGDALWLGGLTLTLAAAGVAAAARIDGLPFPYLVQWIVVIGILAWITVGVSLLPELEHLVRRARGRRVARVRPGTVLGVALAAGAVAAVLVAAIGVGRADTPASDATGEITALERAVVEDLDRLGLRTGPDAPVVRVDFAGTSRTDVFIGTPDPGTGLVLGLYLAGVDVQVSDFWRVSYGPRLTDRADEAGYVATVAFADGSSPPPEPWQQVLAVAGEFAVYGGMPPGE